MVVRDYKESEGEGGRGKRLTLEFRALSSWVCMMMFDMLSSSITGFKFMWTRVVVVVGGVGVWYCYA